MKTILITGGTGFIGNHLCRKLLQNINNRIICLDNNYTGFLENINDLLENNRFTYINADVIDFRDIRNFGNPRKPENFETATTRSSKRTSPRPVSRVLQISNPKMGSVKVLW